MTTYVLTTEPKTKQEIKMSISTTNNPQHLHTSDCVACNHDHDHTHVPVMEEDAQGTVEFDPTTYGAIDLIRSFETAGMPKWNNPAKTMQDLHETLKTTPKDMFIGVMFNLEAYKWMLSNAQFMRMFTPSKKMTDVKSGVVGTIGPRIVLLTDAFLDPEHQVTMKGAYYYVDLVKTQVEEQATVEQVAADEPAVTGCTDCSNCACNPEVVADEADDTSFQLPG